MAITLARNLRSGIVGKLMCPNAKDSISSGSGFREHSRHETVPQRQHHMVKRITSLAMALVSTGFCFSPSLPKDSTTSWCDSVTAYRCYPNPIGAGSMLYWWRVPDTNVVSGCLYRRYITSPSRFLAGTDLYSSEWYPQINSLGDVFGPMIPRISMYVDKSCFDYWTRKGRNPKLSLVKGDSLELEFKMTPKDTSVSDTIRGKMKVYFMGVADHWPMDGDPYNSGTPLSVKNVPHSVTWSQGQILLIHPELGPVILMNLRGQILSTSDRIDGPNTWIAPNSPMAPGVYRLRWPKGQAAVVVPAH